MPFALARVVLGVECLLLFALVLFVRPLPGYERPLVTPSPGLITSVVFGGYMWLAAGFVLYLYGGVVAAFGRAQDFCRSCIPPILGVPLVIWGFAELDMLAGLVVAVLASVMSLLLIAITATATHTPATRWRLLPIVLPAIFWVTSDYKSVSMSLLHLLIGTTLLATPIILKWGRIGAA